MCSNCYHLAERDRKAWLCEHTDKVHYAHGICKTCYHYKYSRSRSILGKNFNEKKGKKIGNKGKITLTNYNNFDNSENDNYDDDENDSDYC